MEPIEEVFIALRRIIRATDLHSKYLVKTTGLTTAQIFLLQAIRSKGQATIGELANTISLSQATVTTIVDRLEKRKLVFRERSVKDKRKVYARLTEEAGEILKNASLPLQTRFTREFSSLNEWEKSMIISSLQRVSQMMDANDIGVLSDVDVIELELQTNQSVPL